MENIIIPWGDPPKIECICVIPGPGPVSDKWRQECHLYGWAICQICEGHGKVQKLTCPGCSGCGTYRKEP